MAALVAARSSRHFLDTLRAPYRHVLRRGFSTTFIAREGDAVAQRIRNIGIIAHIDAGKTTTTERMLYYAGLTRRIGEVDSGDTVTDYLVQERERGITIQAAAVTLGWRDAKINLIDTPGHVDFTVEVERSVRVLDGAVAVLDSAAGVEAQTETVWRQAERYHVPRLVFANKMDRDGASWERVLADVQSTLGATPCPIQLPLEENTVFCGVVDVLRMEELRWSSSGSVAERSGMEYRRTPLTPTHPQFQRAVEARDALAQRLAELDDEMMEAFLEADGAASSDDLSSTASISTDLLQAALRRVTLANQAVPVLCGSSLRNIGVQPLMDAVIDYLPSPLDCPAPQGILPDKSVVYIGTDDTIAPTCPAESGNEPRISPTADQQRLCALAFKVISDAQRGPMVFVRIYSGVLDQRSVLWNATTQNKERVHRIFQMYGDQTEPLAQLSAGNIGVLLGLKQTRTGDTLLLEQDHRRHRHTSPQLAGVSIPPPVFFRSVEPVSTSDEKPLQEALDSLLLEDPSLQVSIDKESGQTLLSGQGELHLEVVGDRLRRDFKVNAELGQVRISYRETAGSESAVKMQYDREVLGRRGRVGMTVTVSPLELDSDTGRPMSIDSDTPVNNDGNCVSVNIASLVDDTGAAASDALDGSILGPAEVRDAIHDGVLAGLSRGPLLGFPITQMAVRVSDIRLMGADSTTAALRACAGQAIGEALTRGHAALLEPMMRVQIRAPAPHIGAVLSDLGGGTRRGVILSMDTDTVGDDDSSSSSSDDSADASRYRVLHANVPLAGLLGYASTLRSLTAGTGTFTMQLHGYGQLSSGQQQVVLKEQRGY